MPDVSLEEVMDVGGADSPNHDAVVLAVGGNSEFGVSVVFFAAANACSVAANFSRSDLSSASDAEDSAAS